LSHYSTGTANWRGSPIGAISISAAIWRASSTPILVRSRSS
jgi:hypothetical protein